MMRRAGLLLLVLGFANLAACGDEAGVVAPDTVLDSGFPIDAAVQDSEVPDEASPVDLSEVGDDPGGALCPGDGCFLEPCESAEDCLSGICTQHMG